MLLLPSTVNDAIQYVHDHGYTAHLDPDQLGLVIVYAPGDTKIIPWGRQVRISRT